MNKPHIPLLLMAAMLVVPAACKTTGPMIAVDSVEFDVGAIKVGSVSKVKHAFKIRNTGDSVLVIRDARPGCGCSVVSFDTTILPGREGTITEDVTLGKIEGEFIKCLTVTSNARNKPDMRLCIKGRVKMPVYASPSYIHLLKGKCGKHEAEMTLSSEKTDLQVGEVFFKSGSNSSSSQTAWQNTLPSYCQYTLTKPEKPNSSGLFDYKLNVSMNFMEKESKFGEFIIKTNHPEAPEVKVTGAVEYVPDQKK